MAARSLVPSSDTGLLDSRLLDSVRGIAALVVLVHHARIYLILARSTAGTLQSLQGSTGLYLLGLELTHFGPEAVLAFFLVSGYAIHYRQAQRLAQGPGGSVIDWRTFAWHRIRRIYPPLLAALAVTAAAVALARAISPGISAGWVGDSFSLRDLLGTVAFLNVTVTSSFGGNVALWSLAVEAFFYVTYPIVLAGNRRLGPVRALAAFGVLGLAAFAVNQIIPHSNWLELIEYWPVWVAGACIADARAGRVRIGDAVWSQMAAGGLVLACWLALISFLVPDFVVAAMHVSVVDILWVIALWPVVGWLAAARHGASARHRAETLLRPLLGLGAMSYSLYVVHTPVFELLAIAWNARVGTLPLSPLLALAGMMLSLGIAFAVSLLTERPVARAGRRVVTGSEGKPGAVKRARAAGPQTHPSTDQAAPSTLQLPPR